MGENGRVTDPRADEPDVDVAVDSDGAAADEAPKRGIFIGLSAGAGGAGGALGSSFAAMDTFFNPAAARAREELDQQHERVVATPSPGDRLLTDGVIVIEQPPPS